MGENYFVSEGDKVTKREDFLFTQSKYGRASSIKFVDLINIQFLNIGCKNKT